MTNAFQQSFEQETKETHSASNRRPLIMLGILCIALCAIYITSVRVVEASQYALRDTVNSRDNLMQQYEDLGKQLDSVRSLSIISQVPVLVGFQEVQKPSYLNMDVAQSVAVAH